MKAGNLGSIQYRVMSHISLAKCCYVCGTATVYSRKYHCKCYIYIYNVMYNTYVITYMMYGRRVCLGFWQKDNGAGKETLQKVHAKSMILIGNEGGTLRNNWALSPLHRNVCLHHKTLTFDLENVQQCPPTWQIFMTSFIKICPLTRKISHHEKQADLWLMTYDLWLKPSQPTLNSRGIKSAKKKLFVVTRTTTKFGDNALCIVRPWVCNSLKFPQLTDCTTTYKS